MKIKYEHIITLNLLHGYFKDGLCRDFAVFPTAGTSALLSQLGWVARPTANGLAIYASVEPGTAPPVLMSPVSGRSAKLVFFLVSLKPNFFNYTKLPDLAVRNEVLYFTNLRDDQVGGNKLLGDQVANQAIGDGIRLISNRTLIYTFNAPVSSVILTLTDAFGRPYPFEGQQFDLSEPISQVSINLDKIEPFPSGRYRITDNHGGQLDFYFEPQLFGKQAFAIIELYSDTNDFTDPAADLVPADYRFLNGNEITGKGHYAIQFETAEINWQYIFRKKPENAGNGIALANLTLASAIAFPAAPTMVDGNAVFRSTNPVPLSEERQPVELNHNGAKILDLPNPGQGHQLQEDAVSKYYDINIYV